MDRHPHKNKALSVQFLTDKQKINGTRLDNLVLLMWQIESLADQYIAILV